jgi:hypothetical protein
MLYEKFIKYKLNRNLKKNSREIAIGIIKERGGIGSAK